MSILDLRFLIEDFEEGGRDFFFDFLTPLERFFVFLERKMQFFGTKIAEKFASFKKKL